MTRFSTYARAAIICLLISGISMTHGCATTGATASASAPPVEELPIIWQKSGTYSRLSRTTHVVVRDRPTLAKIPIVEVPVDFRTQMVLVVGVGPTPTSQTGVRIARVWQEGSRIRVQEQRIHPGPQTKAGLEPASPWTVAVIPRSDLNVEGFDARVPKGTLEDQAGSR